ncbi:Dak1-domain-containing protein [Coprinellus micaceus]|uniref:Dak1-domain-containing protein n=1 Tax=Coprinellus micaceus TaxID=71717 RepID=A0A4Y7RTI1_COPMI|nr:Dak1-domain-containing protein [Coprinellus micaceus]
MSIQSKHFLNSPDTLVLESLKGLCDLNPALTLDADNKILFVKNHNRSKVALVCGGGSGHEPAHSGFVGDGMLTAAVCGHVFASPNASQVRRGIDLVQNDNGTVIIVKNYTGDILNFGLAKEQYAAKHPSEAEKVLGRSQGKIVGRRGLAGTVLVYKIAGALAARGASLDDVHRTAAWVSENVATVGASLGHVHVPGTAPLTTNLASDELEVGMGIHNESGSNHVLLTSVDDPERSFLPFKGSDNVVLLVNNLGGVNELELGGIAAEARKQLSERGLKIVRILSGTFMTSLNMPGFSLTLLLLPNGTEAHSPSASDVISLLDERPQVLGWKWTPATEPLPPNSQIVKGGTGNAQTGRTLQVKSQNPESFVTSIRSVANALIAAEPDITRMDLIAGDGDAGLTLKAGSQGVLAAIEQGKIRGDSVVSSLIAIAQVAEEVMGGLAVNVSSPSHYNVAFAAFFFSALAQGFQSQSIPDGSVVTPGHWVVALSSALDKLYGYTRARRPSRTLVDPLSAFVEAAKQSEGEDLARAVALATEAAEETKNLVAKAGRSAYVSSDHLQKEHVADPGAWGVKVILETLKL